MAEFISNSFSRRNFIKGIAGGLVTTTLIPSNASAENNRDFLTILHTNDVHSHIDSFPLNHPKYPGMGGVEARAKLIAQERLIDPDLLLLDAGDMFQGTPYYNYFGGEPELKIMTYMGYDAGTLGNHEFDSGTSGLARVLPFAGFPILNANYGFEGSELENRILPYKILRKKGYKIGVLGLGVNLKGLVDKRLSGKVVYHDPITISQSTAEMLRRNKKCDLVICLSHLGFKYPDNQVSDLVLATKSADIDVIIGGHTHTFLDEPVFEKGVNGKKILISQAGWAGVRLGKITVNFNRESQEKKNFSSTVIEIKKTSDI